MRFVTLLLGSALLAVSVAGCQTSRTPWAWEVAYEPVAEAPAWSGDVNIVPFDQESPEMQAAGIRPYEILDASPDVTGKRIIGVSRFREVEEYMETFGSDDFQKYAAGLGASDAQIARRLPPDPADRREERTESVLVSSPGTAAPGNIITRGDVGQPTREYRDVVVEVDVFDYIVVFYAPAAGG